MLPDQVIEHVPDQVIEPLPDQVIEPLPDQVIEPLPDQVSNTESGKSSERVPDKVIKGERSGYLIICYLRNDSTTQLQVIDRTAPPQVKTTFWLQVVFSKQ